MADYVLGDIQGCYRALQCLLEKLNFDPVRDQLWCVGDLVNRGAQNLECLRFLKSVQAKVALGNHDLHLLALFYASQKGIPKRKDTLSDVLAAEDCEELLSWLKSRSLMLWLPERNIAMTHAGIPHIWSTEQAFALAQEVEQVLQSEQCASYFDHMYGNEPDVWSPSLQGLVRWRVITNYFTRMRFVDAQGHLELQAKESADTAPEGYAPWFSFARQDSCQLLFGHWAALSGHTGVAGMHALDTGCVWGGALTAMNLSTLERTECDCGAI